MSAPKANGSDIFYYDDNHDRMVKIGCPLGVNGFGNSVEAEDNTGVEDDVAHSEPGMLSGGTVSVRLNMDFKNYAYFDLFNRFNSRNSGLTFFIGLPESKDPVTVNNGDFDAPRSRTWFKFRGFITSFPIPLDPNKKLKTEVAIQVDGKIHWIANVDFIYDGTYKYDHSITYGGLAA